MASERDDMDLTRWEQEILDLIEARTAKSDPDLVRLLRDGPVGSDRRSLIAGVVLLAVGALTVLLTVAVSLAASVAGSAVMGLGLWLVLTSRPLRRSNRRSCRWDRLARLAERLADDD